MDHLDDEYGACGVEVPLLVEQRTPFPQDYASFHAFPELMNWAIDKDNKLRRKTPDSKAGEALGPFLQAWLFFGLIFTVVKTDKGPLLSMDDLVRGETVNSRLLRPALEAWVAWEISNGPGIEMRMIRAEFALEKARYYSRGPSWSIDYMPDEVALILMVLGETIAAVKAKTMSDVDGAQLRGWHAEDESGWGPPRYVVERMLREGWCPRAIRVLNGQLGSIGTLLLAACVSRHSDFDRKRHGERNCDEVVCRAMSETEYAPRHYAGCDELTCQASSKGPSVEHMGQILGMHDDDIPLLRFEDCDEEGFTLVPVKWKRGTEFASISHVWAHGYGNEKKNGLYKCQLAFIRDQLVGVRNMMRNDNSQKLPMLLWMDMLVVPVESLQATRAPRMIAIAQIFRVFRASSCTVVLDGGLSTMPAGNDAQAAIEVLSSGWMRRLWTLQEAFWSNKTYIVFKPGEDAEYSHIRELDQLANNLGNVPGFAAARAGLDAARPAPSQCHGDDRLTREMFLRYSLQTPLQLGPLLRKYFWHYRQALPQDLGIGVPAQPGLQQDQHRKGGNGRQPELDAQMRDFWITFDERGEKLGIPGFGWAPRTWMDVVEPLADATQMEHCFDPLQVRSRTILDVNHGLRVRCAGFILHSQDRTAVLGGNKMDDEAKPADALRANDVHAAGIRDGNNTLAIVLSDPQPRKLVPTIALLVEVWKQSIETRDSGTTSVLYCHVIHRLLVSREPRVHRPSDKSESVGMEQRDDFVIGEGVGPELEWVVDGFFPWRFNGRKNAASKAQLMRMDKSKMEAVPNSLVDMFRSGR
ncbi:hypothetical protein B0T22DRAFT_523894 [Podospora appendiculata]|uniref:Heterokaryon incompatibility domain-containing protein n=1 Tax=Podospora appendiculata TaxID=314037 RepID=A0AAE1C767_9PEZI|nr:hypothetical protein B0T22DRAFT_523894 [Podospora appendiculata]